MTLSKYKKINITLFATVGIIFVALNYFGGEVCRYLDCDYRIIISFLDPLKGMSLWLGLMSGFLLFFSEDYFRNWLKYIASWGFPLSYVLVAAAGHSTSIISPNREEMSALLGIVFAVVTLVYVIYHYLNKKRLDN